MKNFMLINILLLFGIMSTSSSSPLLNLSSHHGECLHTAAEISIISRYERGVY